MSTLPNPNDLDWGSMSKGEFKRMELAYELAHETAQPKRFSKQTTITITATADDVWAAAVAVDRENGGYLKYAEQDENYNIVKRPNKEILKDHLFTASAKVRITDKDRAQAKIIREHFKGYLFNQLAGKLNPFQNSALKCAQLEEFTNKNRLEVALISCLPMVYRNDQDRKKINEAKRSSSHIKGDNFYGEIVIRNVNYSSIYCKFLITAQTKDGNVVNFWYREDLGTGNTVTAKGKVKARRDDNTTQLNYVKIIS
jgi:hypothetical protein